VSLDDCIFVGESEGQYLDASDMPPAYIGVIAMKTKGLNKAVAYFRTSSMTNVCEDKDSLKRQRAAVAAFTKRAGYELIAEYSDDGVKGADPVDQRPGFGAMLKHIAGNGVRTIIVETSSRFARDLITQETGFRFLQGLASR
jgi:DNA invertase Pin-like site-specific DNA recombinase